jgi:hypothetical protein
MIYILAAVCAACVGVAGYVFGLNSKVKYLSARIDKVTDNIGNMAKHVADLEAEIKLMQEADTGEELKKILEKKWDDAIQRISDFDPFNTEADNR